jgi:hypothetical protein
VIGLFSHLLAGSLVFLIIGNLFDWYISRWFLVLGGLCGVLPDILSFAFGKVEYSKWSHRHRDNIFHSLLFPIIAFITVWPLLNIKCALLISLAILTHPLLDSFGLGWGVKLFYPFNKITYKLFYKGKIINKFTQKEIDLEAEKYGMDDWIGQIYFTLNFCGMTEWLCFLVFLILVTLLY